MSEEDEGDEADYEEHSYFMGLCTCDHTEEQHSWGDCDYEGCECQAGWEE